MPYFSSFYLHYAVPLRIATAIVKAIQIKNGRFLKMQGDQYEEVADNVARLKTSQALREELATQRTDNDDILEDHEGALDDHEGTLDVSSVEVGRVDTTAVSTTGDAITTTITTHTTSTQEKNDSSSTMNPQTNVITTQDVASTQSSLATDTHGLPNIAFNIQDSNVHQKIDPPTTATSSPTNHDTTNDSVHESYRKETLCETRPLSSTKSSTLLNGNRTQSSMTKHGWIDDTPRQQQNFITTAIPETSGTVDSSSTTLLSIREYQLDSSLMSHGPTTFRDVLGGHSNYIQQQQQEQQQQSTLDSSNLLRYIQQYPTNDATAMTAATTATLQAQIAAATRILSQQQQQQLQQYLSSQPSVSLNMLNPMTLSNTNTTNRSQSPQPTPMQSVQQPSYLRRATENEIRQKSNFPTHTPGYNHNNNRNNIHASPSSYASQVFANTLNAVGDTSLPPIMNHSEKDTLRHGTIVASKSTQHNDQVTIHTLEQKQKLHSTISEDSSKVSQEGRMSKTVEVIEFLDDSDDDHEEVGITETNTLTINQSQQHLESRHPSVPVNATRSTRNAKKVMSREDRRRKSHVETISFLPDIGSPNMSSSLTERSSCDVVMNIGFDCWLPTHVPSTTLESPYLEQFQSRLSLWYVTTREKIFLYSLFFFKHHIHCYINPLVIGTRSGELFTTFLSVNV